MGYAFKCDMTGKLQEGEGVFQVDVQVNETLVLRVTPMSVINKQKMAQGMVTKEAAAKIEEALSVLKLKVTK
jgi:hypothetical protein